MDRNSAETRSWVVGINGTKNRVKVTRFWQAGDGVSERVVFATNASEPCFLSSHELAGCGNAAPEVLGKPFGNAQTITIFSPLSAFISRENRCTCRVESQRFPAVYEIDSTECGV